MNQHNITFSFNNLEKIVIELEEPFEVVHCCYQAPIVLYFENKKYLLMDDAVRYRICLFITLLTKVLNNEFQLHESIKEDIGYLRNEEFQNKSGLVYEKSKTIDCWVGAKHSLWSGEGVSTWLYNDKKGNIIFEITPHYKYHFSDPEKTPNFMPYEEWAKNYKPYLIRIIPTDVAKQWLDLAHNVLKKIDENTAKEKMIYENNEGKDIYDEWCAILEKEYGITDPRGKEADKVPAEFFTDEWWKKRGL